MTGEMEEKKKEEKKGKTAEHMNTNMNSKEERGNEDLHEKNLFSA